MNKKAKGWILWIVILLIMLLFVCLLSMFYGSVGIPINRLIEIILKGEKGGERIILFDLRLSRIILGIAFGGGLSLCGVILQGMFRNPLVEPYTLGISGGAALGVCIGIVLKLSKISGSYILPVSGFAGAVFVVIIIYALSIRKGKIKIQNLLLTGVMISFVCSSLVMLLMAISRSEDLHGIIFWTMGSLAVNDWLLVKISITISLTLLFISLFFTIDLNAISLGEEEAIHLGVNIERSKKALFFIVSILSGISVSVAGVIGFVGLIVPHIMRMIFGNDHRILLISSYIGGAIFLILCDTIARTIISPLELPVGVITGIFGGGLFIYALNRRKVSV